MEQCLCVNRLFAEPASPLFFLNHYRYSIMELRHFIFRLSGNYGKRSQDVSIFKFSRFPKSRQRNEVSVLSTNCIRLFDATLISPFVISINGNQTAASKFPSSFK